MKCFEHGPYCSSHFHRSLLIANSLLNMCMCGQSVLVNSMGNPQVKKCDPYLYPQKLYPRQRVQIPTSMDRGNCRYGRYRLPVECHSEYDQKMQRCICTSWCIDLKVLSINLVPPIVNISIVFLLFKLKISNPNLHIIVVDEPHLELPKFGSV